MTDFNSLSKYQFNKNINSQRVYKWVGFMISLSDCVIRQNKQPLPVSTRRRFDVVITLFGRPNNVVTTSRRHCVLAGSSPLCLFCTQFVEEMKNPLEFINSPLLVYV